jgi:hypothetical protein
LYSKIHFNLLNPIFVKIENPHSKHGKTIRKKVNTAIMKLEKEPIVILHGLMGGLVT